MRNLNNAGFSLIQTLFILATVGAGSVLLMKQQDISSSVQAKEKVSQEVAAASDQIQILLGNSANCTSTLKGFMVGEEIPELKRVEPHGFQTDIQYPSPDDELSFFFEPAGDQFLKPGSRFGRSEIKRMQLITKNIQGETDVEALRVTFFTEGSKAAGGHEVSQDFIIRGVRLNASEYKFCFSEPAKLDTEDPLGRKLISEGVKIYCEESLGSSPSGDYFCNLTGIPDSTITFPGYCSPKGYRIDTAGTGTVPFGERSKSTYRCYEKFEKSMMKMGLVAVGGAALAAAVAASGGAATSVVVGSGAGGGGVATAAASCGGGTHYIAWCDVDCPRTDQNCKCKPPGAWCYKITELFCEPKHEYEEVPVQICRRFEIPPEGL